MRRAADRASAATSLAWCVGGLALVLFSMTMAFVALRPPRLPDGVEQLDVLGALLETGPFLVFVGLGVLIATARPQNQIGWMFTSIGVLFLFTGLAAEYALYGLYTDPGSLPAGAFMAWISIWLWLIGANLIVLVILLFPDGLLPSPRWRPLKWFVVANAVLPACTTAIFLWPHRGFRLLGDLAGATVSSAAEEVATIGFYLLLVSLLPAAASMVVRFRRASGEQHQQMKWVVYGASLLVGTSLLTEASAVAGITLGYWASQLLDAVGILAVPVAAGIAILKHRLYDIDVIINRTLVYGALTVSLALVYVAGTFVLGGALRSLTEQQDNGLAVAASTLAVAALFRPARSRIQAFIDRRFYRRKYDAAQTLEAFSTRLRDQVDLDALNADLLTVVTNTVQPAHVSVWLRSAGRPTEGTR